MKRFYFIFVVFPLLCSCVKDVPIGFLSPTGIRMREDTLNVVGGVYFVSSIPMVDGSTRPLHFEIMDVTDLSTGKKTDVFSKKQKVRLWKSPFNPDTDITLDLVKQKLIYADTASLMINNASGQLAFSQGTMYINPGVYAVDAKVSSQAGERVLEKFGIVNLIKKPWEVPNNFGEYFYGSTSTEFNKVIQTRNPLPVSEMEQVKKNTHARFSIEKIAEGEDVKVKLMFLDANGEAFDGKAIANWPQNDTYLNNWFDNSVDTKVMSDGVEFNFPTVPFPAFARVYTGGRESITLSYYVLHPNYYTLTQEAKNMAAKFESDNGITFNSYNLQVKIVYQINEPGSWLVKVKFAYALKKK